MSIPKVEAATNIKDFWPISLVGNVYKLIEKVLSKHMVKIMGKVVGEFQHTFLEWRQIMCKIMVANEIVDDLLFRDRDGVLCKLYTKEAYDHIN